MLRAPLVVEIQEKAHFSSKMCFNYVWACVKSAEWARRSQTTSLLNHFQDLNVWIINRKSGNIILDVRDNYGFLMISMHFFIQGKFC